MAEGDDFGAAVVMVHVFGCDKDLNRAEGEDVVKLVVGDAAFEGGDWVSVLFPEGGTLEVEGVVGVGLLAVAAGFDPVGGCGSEAHESEEDVGGFGEDRIVED